MSKEKVTPWYEMDEVLLEDRVFLGIWGDGYTMANEDGTAFSDTRYIDEFGGRNGYEPEMTNAISTLRVGQSYNVPAPESHSVIRIK
jgi:hypothetical protein